MSLIAELRRRNVVRVALLYGLAAWLILQVADVLVPALGLPVTALRFVSLILILGFPVAVIFAWVYELTPEGLKKQHEVDRGQSVTAETGRKLNILIGVLAALAIVVVAADRLVPKRQNAAATEEGSAAGPAAVSTTVIPVKSIAVLPFVDMKPGKGPGVLRRRDFRGSTEPARQVAGPEGDRPNLTLRSTRARTPRSADIARELQVAHVLEGKCAESWGTRCGSRRSSFTAADSTHLWSETYDRELDRHLRGAKRHRESGGQGTYSNPARRRTLDDVRRDQNTG